MERGWLLAVIVGALVFASSAAAITPNDPAWGEAWAQRQVNMPAAWDITTGSPSIVAAVVDTGVDPSIGDLRGALVPGWDFVENDAVPQDEMGHGTLEASALAGRGNDGIGVAGYCWRCRVMPLRVSSSGFNFDPSLTAAAIRWAVEHGARIISLAFNDDGVYPADPQISAAIAYAAQSNVLVIASSGNAAASMLTHPASDPGAYAVAGTDPNDQLYWWSTFGPWIGLAAPGCQMMTEPGGTWRSACGNSAATPAVAGIAGLVLSANPALTAAQVASILQTNAVPVPGIGGGRVDAYRAVRAAQALIPKPPPPPPPPPPAAALQRLRPAPSAKMTTRVQRGMLGGHRVFRIKVAAGRVTATLRSPKAASCSVSLKSSTDVWLAASQRRYAVSLAAKVPAGRYRVDVSCTRRRPAHFALVLRALFD